MYHHPSCTWTPIPMDLGRVEISKGPSNRGGWTLDLSVSPTDPLGGGGWTLDFSRSPADPPTTSNSLQNHLINRLKTLFLPTRCARGWHFSGTDPVFVSQGRWSMIPSGVCDLVYCGAGCLGLSRGGLDLGLFRMSNRPSGRGALDLGPFRKSDRPSEMGGLDLGL